MIYVLDKKRKEEISQRKEVIQNKKEKHLSSVVFVVDFFLMLGSSLQQIGIQYTTAGRNQDLSRRYIF